MSEISFKVEEKYLYTDEELVEFNIPIFFICKDEVNQKYAVLCVDSEELIYVVAKVAIKDILLMLDSEITLRDFFMKTSEKWRIYAGEDYLSDEIEKIEEFQDNELPISGAYFELSNSKIKKYVERLAEENPIRQYKTIIERGFNEVYRCDGNFISPVMRISKKQEWRYSTWHCKEDNIIDFLNSDELLHSINEDLYFSKGVVCHG